MHTFPRAHGRADSKITVQIPNSSDAAGATKVAVSMPACPPLASAKPSMSLPGRLASVTLAVAMVAVTAGCGVSGDKAAAPASQPAPQPSPVVLTEHKTAGGDPGVELYLREKRSSAVAQAPKGKVVIFLEPFGVPTAKAFDVPGLSWMDSLAGTGYDTWALDFRGFGQSSRPPAMSQPPMANPPLTSTAEAVRDLDAAVSFITKARGVDAVSLVGWSWGGVVGGAYAAEHPVRVDKLVLDGTMHAFSLPMMTKPLESAPGVMTPLPAYLPVSFDQTTKVHWNMMMAGRPLATPASIEAVSKVFMAADPTSGQRTPPSIRRAMGPMVDLYSIWSNKPIYDATKVTAPVLVIAGDSDIFADKTLFCGLTNSIDRREVTIPQATHWALYETHRDVLLSQTAKFLGAASASTSPADLAKCKK
jgi:pimeloyl-ACP methyl ester carboxylesterase